MANFSDFIKSLDPEKKGVQFEHFVKWFLKNDPEWSTQVDEIWLWDEYPKRWGPDLGIDLVFHHKNKEIWAVQAKCYSTEYPIKKSDVDTFLSESNRQGIDKRLLISSTDIIGRNAKQVCFAQEKPVTLFLYSDFEKSAIEYPKSFKKLNTAKAKKKPKPRTHQKEAIKAVEKGLKNTDRGQLIMACGTGKTFTTLWIKEKLQAKSTLILLPSLSLLSQTLREWTSACNEEFDVLCVCSDETVGRKASEDEVIQSVKDISFPVTTAPNEVSVFLRKRNKKVIFSTYQSSPIIAEAQSKAGSPKFDLVIADEAHRCTGEVGNAFTTVLDEIKIKAKKRLFTTATPRTYSPNIKKRAIDRGVEVTGMDDEAVFGKILYDLNFGSAIKQKLLTDYQVVIIGVDEPMIAEWIAKRELVRTESGDTLDAKSLAAQIGLIKAIKDYDLNRMISFHSRVKRAENFSLELHKTIGFVEDEYQLDGVWADFVSGAMPTYNRRLKLEQLKNITKGNRGLLANARCLAEGVDVPSLDGVAFIDPRGSQVDIVQAVGRAIRLNKNKTVGTIVLPVFIENGDDPEVSIQSSNYKPVWSVLNALKSHDEELSFELDNMRTALGRENSLGKNGDSFSKIIFDLPLTVNQSFSNSLQTYLVEKTTTSWNFWFGLLEKYFKQEGNSLVRRGFQTKDGYELGRWVGKQRDRKDSLSKEKMDKLNSLNFDWDPRKSSWEDGFSYLKNYFEKEGNIIIPQDYITEDNYKLGFWISNQRARKKRLTPSQIEKLNSLGFVWNALEANWEEGYSHLKIFFKKRGHVSVSSNYKTKENYKLGIWIQRQRSIYKSLDSDKKSKLNCLGFEYNVNEKLWNERFNLLKEYVERNGNALVPNTYKTEDGYLLGRWVGHQRQKKESLTQIQIKKLESLEFCWDPHTFKWNQGFVKYKEYVEREGNTLSLFKKMSGFFPAQEVSPSYETRRF